ncbi:MAG: hypothetical protein ACYC1L_02040 [Alphaproteobacteria bacterium]
MTDVAYVGPNRPNRWHGHVGEALKALWDLYGVEGPAKANDETALQQLRWAIKRQRERAGHGGPKSLFPEEVVARVVHAIRDAVEHASQQDLELITQLPDLPICRTSSVLAEDWYSGNEYEKSVELDAMLDLSDLRNAARSRQPQ